MTQGNPWCQRLTWEILKVGWPSTLLPCSLKFLILGAGSLFSFLFLVMCKLWHTIMIFFIPTLVKVSKRVRSKPIGHNVGEFTSWTRGKLRDKVAKINVAYDNMLSADGGQISTRPSISTKSSMQIVHHKTYTIFDGPLPNFPTFQDINQ